jgi:hypothetical protein
MVEKHGFLKSSVLLKEIFKNLSIALNEHLILILRKIFDEADAGTFIKMVEYRFFLFRLSMFIDNTLILKAASGVEQ